MVRIIIIIIIMIPFNASSKTVEAIPLPELKCYGRGAVGVITDYNYRNEPYKLSLVLIFFR